MNQGSVYDQELYYDQGPVDDQRVKVRPGCEQVSERET